MLPVPSDATPSRVAHTKTKMSKEEDCDARLGYYLTISANSYCTAIEGNWICCSNEGSAGDNRAPCRGAEG